MADSYTTNLNLKKPGHDSPADIADINDNMDKIDTSVNQLSQQMAAVSLLDNSNFRIAQAGYGGAHGSTKYAADRWAFVGTSVEKLSETGGIKVTGSQWSAKVRQFIPNPTSYIGKTLTFAARMRSSNLAQGYIAIFPMKENGAYIEGYTTYYPALTFEWGTYVVRCTIPAGTEKIAVAFDNSVAGLSASNSYDIEWTALYEGSYTVETLPPYAPKRYAVELAECQRRFHAYETESARPSKPLDCCPPMELAPGTTDLTQGTVEVDGKTLYFNSTDL